MTKEEAIKAMRDFVDEIEADDSLTPNLTQVIDYERTHEGEYIPRSMTFTLLGELIQ